jgi:NAD(P)-dependent dehydrogenase (short-subunit alcohol dehydrogenase family)
MSLDKKVTIITGATGGLGQTVSEVFYQAGASVVLVGSRLEKVQSLAGNMGSERALPVAANLADPAGSEMVVTAALERFGRVDILLNLAGGFSGGQPLSQSSVDELNQMLDINLRTAYNMCRAAIKPMITQNWGRIVNFGSRDALHARPNYSAYAISKAGVLKLTEALAEELKQHNITVNIIIPGTIDTGANHQAMPTADTSRWLKPATIAETLLFLVREDTAINGAAIPLYEQF